MKKSLFIGLLSGTSMDALDAALVSFDNTPPQLLSTFSYPIPEDFRKRCLEISQSGRSSIIDYGQLDARAGELFAEAALALLNKADINPEEITAIGSHGLTLGHQPNIKPPFSLQIGDPNIIAERTRIVTIADFRRRDMAAGGQGAPLAPGFHAAVLSHAYENRVIVNIGGISNLSILSKDSDIVLGFDSGPGNCLMDAYLETHLNIRMDENGRIAASGNAYHPLLQACLADPYFTLKPPKSTGRDYFNLPWLAQHIIHTDAQDLSLADMLATLLTVTTQSIATAIEGYAPKDANVFICGGGAHNQTLLYNLSVLLQKPVYTTEKLGIAPDWMEAMLFAWLAKQTLEGKAGNCPSVTGAKRALALGGIFGHGLKA